jgi:hypothetical protein
VCQLNGDKIRHVRLPRFTEVTYGSQLDALVCSHEDHPKHWRSLRRVGNIANVAIT